jgi:hypothetical protein
MKKNKLIRAIIFTGLLLAIAGGMYAQIVNS